MKTCKECPAFKKNHIFERTCECGKKLPSIMSDACIMAGYNTYDTMIQLTEADFDMCVKGYLLLACHKQRNRAVDLDQALEELFYKGKKPQPSWWQRWTKRLCPTCKGTGIKE